MDDFIYYAIRGNLEMMMTKLRENPNINPGGRENEAIREASVWGHVDVVRFLLEDPRVDPADVNNYAIRAACDSGSVEVASVLLQDSRVNPGANDNEAIVRAAISNKVEIVRLLVGDPRVNPSARNNEALKIASTLGSVEVVRLLLQDERVNPSDIKALTIAAENGHVEVVRVLLKDPRVNPGEDKSLVRACKRYYTEVVKVLVEDDRVDDIRYPIQIAIDQNLFGIAMLLLGNEKAWKYDVNVDDYTRRIFSNFLNNNVFLDRDLMIVDMILAYLKLDDNFLPSRVAPRILAHRKAFQDKRMETIKLITNWIKKGMPQEIIGKQMELIGDDLLYFPVDVTRHGITKKERIERLKLKILAVASGHDDEHERPITRRRYN